MDNRAKNLNDTRIPEPEECSQARTQAENSIEKCFGKVFIDSVGALSIPLNGLCMDSPQEH